MVSIMNTAGGCVSKPLLLILIWIYSSQHMLSKEFIVYRDKVFSKKVHLHFNTPLSFSPRAKTDFTHPDFQQTFYPSSNFYFGMTGLYNFNADYSLSVGLNLVWFSYTSMRADFLIPAKYTEMYVTDDPANYRGDLSAFDDRFMPYNYFWTIPLNFIHRIPISNKMDFRYSVGFDIKLISSFESTSSGRFNDIYNDSLPIAYYMNYTIGPSSGYGVHLDALISAGINRYLKNNKYINFNFFVNVPMYKPIEGEFGFLLDTPFEARGTFKKYDLAFGFEFNYVFTFIRREKRMPAKQETIE